MIEHVDDEDVILNIVDPGMTKGSGLGREAGGVEGLVVSLILKVVGRTLAAASSIYIDAAIVKGQETHGCFVMDWDVKP